MTLRTAPPEAVSVDLVVPFHDVDPLQIVWHGHYYKYFEHARTALLQSRGLDVADFLALGYRMVVIESHCRYIQPLRYGDRFTVSAWFGDIDQRVLVAYEIRTRTPDRRIARGRTALVTTNPAGGMYLETPDAIRARIRP